MSSAYGESVTRVEFPNGNNEACKFYWTLYFLTTTVSPQCKSHGARHEQWSMKQKPEEHKCNTTCLDKKVTDFRQETQCVEDAGIYLVLASFATGVHGCTRECGATDLC